MAMQKSLAQSRNIMVSLSPPHPPTNSPGQSVSNSVCTKLYRLVQFVPATPLLGESQGPVSFSALCYLAVASSLGSCVYSLPQLPGHAEFFSNGPLGSHCPERCCLATGMYSLCAKLPKPSAPASHTSPGGITGTREHLYVV